MAEEGLSREREGYEEAESIARRALEVEPEALEIGLLLARILDRSARYPEAIGAPSPNAARMMIARGLAKMAELMSDDH